MSTNNKWMLFYRESDFNYYLFNGEWPIAVRPKEHGFGWENGSDSIEVQNRRTEAAIPVMQDVLNSPRKKVFVDRGHKYIIAQRGQFAEL